MSRLLVPLAVLALFTACSKDKDAPTHSDEPEDTGPIDTGTLPVSVSGAWVDQSTFTLTITNGLNNFELGMAQTGAYPYWDGEDCQADNICHPTSATGLTLTSVHPVVGGGGINDIVAGSTTLFYADQADGITYMVRDPVSSACWVWGQDKAYYDALGCTPQ